MHTTRRDFLALAAATALPGARRGVHQVYELSGTPFEVGLQHGKALRREIREEAGRAAQDLARQSATSVEAAAARILSRYEGLFREHVPAVLDEIHGIAEGAELSYAYAFFAATRDLMRTHSCTAVACSGTASRGRRVLIGQNKDTSAPLERFRIMKIAYNSGRRMLVLNYAGWIANLCLTSDGLSFTGNSLYAARPNGPTVPGSLLKRLIMEARSARDLVEHIKGIAFENGCFLVGDPSGQVVCLELVAGHTDLRDISGQAFGHANEVLAKGLKKYEIARKHSASSPMRQRNVDRLLREQAGAIDIALLERVFSDHADFPLSICRHPSPLDAETTNASFVADLSSREMHISIGNPCVAPFQKYALPF